MGEAFGETSRFTVSENWCEDLASVDDLIHRNDQFHVNDDSVVNDGDDDEQSHFFDVSDEFDHIEIFEHHDTDRECVYVPKSFCVGSEEISSSGIKSWTPNVDKSLLPAIGMVFDSIDLAYNFYKDYAVNGGFEVRKSSSKRGFDDLGNSLVRYKYFLCSKQGSNHEILHKPKDVSATDDIFDMNADCFGEVNTLTSVDDNLNQARIGPCRGYRILGKVKGGDEDVGCSKWELAGAFWADQASKENYKVFGDVVSFDSTFRTNKYDMKFISFTGIDNHKKCVTFGAALLAKEDADSYKWLCEAFKKAFPEEPQIVLIDQDPSMIVAIEAVFKKARHRLCMWHVTEKITNKIGPAVSNVGFKDSISQIAWTDKLDPDEFDKRWFSIVARYKLEDNNWLNEMFNLRRKWIPAYFRY
ncbi:protein FAR1-RELATED SEQUENCE 5-like [Rutidosis leptorrhynchoides]|uniref:protein FAR1-RELATED SEQUENCE 5-like n=1 Tax=Rutidosis leptorrhynchoides TaxID=125765 RepID=UPI003A99591D